MNVMPRCALWGAKAYQYDSEIDYRGIRIYSSARTCGSYSIDRGIAEREAPYLDDDVKARLTTYLIRSRQLGNQIPHISQRELEEARAARPMPVHERAISLLSYIANETSLVGDAVNLRQLMDGALAWSESTNDGEVAYLASYLRNLGLLLVTPQPHDLLRCTVSVDGYSSLEDNRQAARPDQAFVAMWFDDTMDSVYYEGIKPAAEDAGYAVFRADQTPSLDKIDDKIIREIRRSRFVIADFTQGEDGNRGSVYYEAGFARGLGLPVISTCREDQLANLAFDTRQFMHISWNEPSELRPPLANMIGAEIGEGAHSVS